MSTKTILKYSNYLVLLIAGCLLMWFTFKGQDIDQLLKSIKSADYRWIAAAIFITFLSHYIRGLRWRMLIRPLGFAPSAVNTYHAVMVGYLANLAFPRMGEITKCGILNKTDHIPVNSLIGTVITERFFDLLFLLIVLASAILLRFETISGFVTLQLSFLVEKIVKSGTILAMVALGFILVSALAFWFISSALKKDSAFALKFKNLTTGLKNGILSVLEMENKGLFIAYSILIWTMYLLSTWFCFYAISATSSLGFAEAVAILGIGGIGMTAPVQGGIGAYHWIVSEGLLLFNISKTDGLAYATINHSTQTLFVIVAGFISLIYIFIFNKNYQKQIDE